MIQWQDDLRWAVYRQKDKADWSSTKTKKKTPFLSFNTNRKPKLLKWSIVLKFCCLKTIHSLIFISTFSVIIHSSRLSYVLMFDWKERGVVSRVCLLIWRSSLREYTVQVWTYDWVPSKHIHSLNWCVLWYNNHSRSRLNLTMSSSKER